MKIENNKLESALTQMISTRKTGAEQFTSNNKPLTTRLLDFWQWSSSDLIINSMRGILAEYIVAKALGQDKKVRSAWDPFDLITNDGIKIEVKSGAYVQSWYQKSYSKIVFQIRETRAWNPQTNNLEQHRKRQADVYVFALLHHQCKSTVDPMNLDQWTFFVIATNRLPNAKSMTLAKLRKLNPSECSYEKLNDCIKMESAGISGTNAGGLAIPENIPAKKAKEIILTIHEDGSLSAD